MDGYSSALAFHDTVASANASSFMAAVDASSVAFAATCVEPFTGSTAASGADVVVGPPLVPDCLLIVYPCTRGCGRTVCS